MVGEDCMVIHMEWELNLSILFRPPCWASYPIGSLLGKFDADTLYNVKSWGAPRHDEHCYTCLAEHWTSSFCASCAQIRFSRTYKTTKLLCPLFWKQVYIESKLLDKRRSIILALLSGLEICSEKYSMQIGRFSNNLIIYTCLIPTLVRPFFF